MVTFSLVEDGADRCLGGIDRKRQLGIGAGEGQRCRLSKTGFQAFKGVQLFAGHFYWAVWCTSQGGEGRCDCRVVRDETVIGFDHTKESSELEPGARLGVVSYSFDFGFEGPYTLVMYHVTEETYFGSPKAALIRIHHQSVLV